MDGGGGGCFGNNAGPSWYMVTKLATLLAKTRSIILNTRAVIPSSVKGITMTMMCPRRRQGGWVLRQTERASAVCSLPNRATVQRTVVPAFPLVKLQVRHCYLWRLLCCRMPRYTAATIKSGGSVLSSGTSGTTPFPRALILRAPHLAHRRGRSISSSRLPACRLPCFETSPEASRPITARQTCPGARKSPPTARSKPWRPIGGRSRNWSRVAPSSPSYRYRPDPRKCSATVPGMVRLKPPQDVAHDGPSNDDSHDIS
jgi:hypothetical protein